MFWFESIECFCRRRKCFNGFLGLERINIAFDYENFDNSIFLGDLRSLLRGGKCRGGKATMISVEITSQI
jgi:hypothetical protein